MSTLDPGQLEAARAEVLRHLDPLDADPSWLFGSVDAFEAELRRVVAYVCRDTPEWQKPLEDALLGWGPLQPLWDDPDVEEIEANGPDSIWTMRRGVRERADIVLPLGHLRRLLDSQLARVDRQLTRAQPLVDATLADGSRIAAQDGSVGRSEEGSFTLRRQRRFARSLDALAKGGLMDCAGLALLKAAVVAQKNLLVAGSMGAGKTTLLSALVAAAPSSRRVATLEDVAEVEVPDGRNHIGLLARPAGAEGTGAIAHADLLVAAKRLTPDLVVLGEVRGAEAAELLQAIRVGDGGAMGTIHAQDAATALSTFIDLACRGGSDRDRVHREVAESLHFIVFVSRDRATGQRRIREVVRPVLRDGRAETDPILTWDPTSDRWDVDAFDAFSELGVGLGRDR